MGKQETLETIWEVPGRALGTDRTYHPGGRPSQSPGPQALCPTTDAQRHHLPAAQRVPMEPIAERACGRQHHSSHLSTVGRDGRLAPNVGSPGGGVRRVGWRGLGMAGGRRSHGQGTFWGDLIGPNPTDRGKAGTKRSLLVDGEGGPLSIVVAGANVHDAKLLEATLDAIVVERPQPTEEEPQHLCLDKGYDNPSGRGAAAGHGYREHIRRIGEEKLDASGDKRYPARRWVVERTLAWLSQVPCGPGPVRQEGSELPRCVTARMCAPVVPATVASGHFEIVTKP